ncbi:MAG: hypothetical protein HGB26_08255 [Desulfobulbaceae bacterium]|nr:hypothetical protein [Desulfobulbaceae bacterium]
MERQEPTVIAVPQKAKFLAVGAVLIAFLFGISCIVSMNYESFNAYRANKSDKDKHALVEKYEGEFSDANAELDDLDSVARDQLYWSKFLVKMSRAVPGKIEVMSITTANYSVTLTGQAETRDDLITFKDDLSKDGCFKEIDLPLSNLVSKDNVAFQMNFKISPDCLK